MKQDRLWSSPSKLHLFISSNRKDKHLLYIVSFANLFTVSLRRGSFVIIGK